MLVLCWFEIPFLLLSLHDVYFGICILPHTTLLSDGTLQKETTVVVKENRRLNTRVRRTKLDNEDQSRDITMAEAEVRKFCCFVGVVGGCGAYVGQC